MRVLYVASEAHPLVKTGGLGDVAGALPAALRTAGVDARLLLPGYPGVVGALRLRRAARDLALLPGAPPAHILQGRMPDGETPLLVLECPALFARDGGPYQSPDGSDWPDNALRFAMLARAAALLATRATPLRWRPDVLHLNDWQSGLAAAYLAFSPDAAARCLMTIHNIAFPGAFPPWVVPAVGLPWEGFTMHGFEFHGHVGYLKAGVYYSDHVTTVSPRYAAEIRTESYGAGLHGLLAGLGERLTGILNGIDEETWNPAIDPHLARRYRDRSLHLKKQGKAALQREVGLPEEPDVPLLGVVSRLTWQKGIDLVPPVLEHLADRPFQLVALGSGEAAVEESLRGLERAAPRRVRFLNRFDEGLAHRIEAGADIYLMPSRFEPCGLNQMYSMRYGTPPVVRATGGLADTVVDATPDAIEREVATGFVFDHADVQGLAWALERALALYSNKRTWRLLQRAGMRGDFSWSRSARAYTALYERLDARGRNPT